MIELHAAGTFWHDENAAGNCREGLSYGAGFTCERRGTGLYLLTWNEEARATPIVVANSRGNDIGTVFIRVLDAKRVEFEIRNNSSNAVTDDPLEFISVIGRNNLG